MELDIFRRQLVELEPALDAWGAWVEIAIRKLAKDANVKIQLTSKRVKEIPSAVGKIARKGYKNPLDEMTDLVGVRIVVLLSPEVSLMREIVEGYPEWDARLSRDPAFEKDQDPERFDYQSLHIEIRPKADLEFEKTTIPKQLCCELQVRTLMQHTYAEVVHDNIYKRVWSAPSKARRYVASSAALIDTADHLFCETMSVLEQENKERGELLEQLASLYTNYFSNTEQWDQKLNIAVLEEYSELFDTDIVALIQEMMGNKPFIAEKIRERAVSDLFWSQPIVLAVYWLVCHKPHSVYDRWPFASSREAIELIYSDLGISF